MPKLSKLFSPKAVAVVGVSSEPRKLGSVVFTNILESGFTKVYPVNPNYDDVLGHRCYHNLGYIHADLDLVVIVVPAAFVPQVMVDVAAKNVENVIIISAGFRETGEEGQKLEAEVMKIAKSNGINILGPNCLGIDIPSSKLNASFSAKHALPGNIAFLSQSGAVNTAMLDLAAEVNLGFSHFVSVGNKIGLTEIDFLEYWLEDPQVKVIGMYIEQFADGNDFMKLVNYSKKPIIILHPGESKVSQQAISSHTGSLAGSSATVRAALRQAGAIQVDSLERMFDTLWLLSVGYQPAGNKVAIVTNAGGPGIMLTDMLEKSGLDVVQLGRQTQQKLRKVLPPTASTHNPIDLVGDALADRYEKALEIVAIDEEVDSVLAVLTPQLVTQVEETAKVIINISKQTSKPVIPLFIGGEFVHPGLHWLTEAGLPAFQYPEQAVNALASVSKVSKLKKRKQQRYLRVKPKHLPEVERKLSAKVTPLPQDLTFEIAAEVGLHMPQQVIVKNFEEAVGFAAEQGFPLVLKALSEDVIHKTDVKALYLNISSLEELHTAFGELQESLQKVTAKKYPEILVQKQLTAGEELLIG
ncbi:CoA-binding protein, partial [Candidatus Dojkabacteria bacterium]|nr:CoA-binding protein [Candidatus Dojkabacteria bacterium]